MEPKCTLLIKAGVVLVLSIFLMVPIHEFGHHIATWLLGGTDEVTYIGIWEGLTWVHLQGIGLHVVALSGGLFTSIIFGILTLLVNDNIYKMIFSGMGIGALAYAMTETVGMLNTYGLIVDTLVCILPVGYYVRKELNE